MKRTPEQVAANRAAVDEVIQTTGSSSELVADDADGTPRPVRRPRSLFVSEMRLRGAFDAMTAEDPECEMTEPEAESFIAQFVNPQAALAVRDEFGDFIEGMRALAIAKRAEGIRLKEEAEAIEEGIDRMTAAAVRTMEALNVDELRGHHRVLAVKRSRGAVEVLDEAQIPRDYFRVREDDDLKAARGISELFRETVKGVQQGIVDLKDIKVVTGIIVKIRALLQPMEAARTSIDKTAIQNRWKAAGGDTIAVEDAAEQGVAAALFPGGRSAAALKKAGIDRVPVVPGVVKKVTTKLEIK